MSQKGYNLDKDIHLILSSSSVAIKFKKIFGKYAKTEKIFSDFNIHGCPVNTQILFQL